MILLSLPSPSFFTTNDNGFLCQNHSVRLLNTTCNAVKPPSQSTPSTNSQEGIYANIFLMLPKSLTHLQINMTFTFMIPVLSHQRNCFASAGQNFVDHFHTFLESSLKKRLKGRSVETLKEQCLFREWNEERME